MEASDRAVGAARPLGENHGGIASRDKFFEPFLIGFQTVGDGIKLGGTDYRPVKDVVPHPVVCQNHDFR